LHRYTRIKKIVSSRRDDLESLGYTLISLYQGLPWDKIKDWEKVEKIKEKSFLFRDNELPEILYNYLKYVRTLQFDEKPDYKDLRQQFRKCLEENSWKLDFIYEWTKVKAAKVAATKKIKGQ